MKNGVMNKNFIRQIIYLSNIKKTDNHRERYNKIKRYLPYYYERDIDIKFLKEFSNKILSNIEFNCKYLLRGF